MGQSAPSIQDVAREAGVAASTVSRVLNQGSASAKAKAKVEAAIEKLGFIPDARAAALRSGKTFKIGLVIPDISHPIYANAAKCIHDALGQHGYRIILRTTFQSLEEEVAIVQELQQDGVDGLIINTSDATRHDESKKSLALNSLTIPTVFLGTTPYAEHNDLVSVSNQVGTQHMAQYAIDTGRKAIAYLGAGLEHNVSALRMNGVSNKLKEKDLSLHAMVCEGDFTLDNGRQLFRRLMSEAPDTDFVVCSNDHMAIGAIMEAQSMDLSIPEQIGIAGFDDIELASLMTPTLTTLRQPLDQLCTRACERLLARIQGDRSPAHHILLEPDLILRQST